MECYLICYRGKHVKETMCEIMLQETVWALSNIHCLFGKLMLLRVNITSKVSIISKLVYHLEVSIN